MKLSFYEVFNVSRCKDISGSHIVRNWPVTVNRVVSDNGRDAGARNGSIAAIIDEREDGVL